MVSENRKTNVTKMLFVILIGLLLATVQANAASDEEIGALINQGDAFFHQGDFHKALYYYNEAKSKRPSDPGIWEKMAWAAAFTHNFEEANKHIDKSKALGMDNNRVARVKAWTYLVQADDLRADGNISAAKEHYQHAYNFSSGGIDAEVGNRAGAALAQLNSSDDDDSDESSDSDDEEDSDDSSDSDSSENSSDDDDDDDDDEDQSIDRLEDTEEAKSLTPPDREEIEERIKSFAEENDFDTFTDPQGRMQVKDKNGNVIPLGPEIFAPSGEMPDKDTIESRIKKWAGEMDLDTDRDGAGRLIVKNDAGQMVPLPPSIFYPVKSEDDDEDDQDDEADEEDDAATEVEDDEDSEDEDSADEDNEASVIEQEEEEITSPEDSLLNAE